MPQRAKGQKYRPQFPKKQARGGGQRDAQAASSAGPSSSLKGYSLPEAAPPNQLQAEHDAGEAAPVQQAAAPTRGAYTGGYSPLHGGGKPFERQLAVSNAKPSRGRGSRQKQGGQFEGELWLTNCFSASGMASCNLRPHWLLHVACLHLVLYAAWGRAARFLVHAGGFQAVPAEVAAEGPSSTVEARDEGAPPLIASCLLTPHPDPSGCYSAQQPPWLASAASNELSSLSKS